MKGVHEMKWLFKVFGLASIVLLLWFANAMLGNPISAVLAKHAAQDYLAENFAHADYYIENVAYNFKDGNYYAHIRSDSSIDTRFSLYITMTGKVRFDTYESVADGFVTANRLEGEYRALTDMITDDVEFPYKDYDSFAYGTLEIYPPEAMWDAPSYAIDQSTLIIDHMYDIRELGRQAGHLVIYVDSHVVTVERAAEIMLDIKSMFDAAEIPFAAMTFVMQHPRTEDGTWNNEEVRVEHFLYEDIYEEDLVERIKEADAAMKAYYAELDAMYKK